jgi:hypothetical protein
MDSGRGLYFPEPVDLARRALDSDAQGQAYALRLGEEFAALLIESPRGQERVRKFRAVHQHALGRRS